MGWPTGLEPATTRNTNWSSYIELRPPSRTEILVFRRTIANARAEALALGTLHASSKPDAPSFRCNPHPVCYHPRPEFHEENPPTPRRGSWPSYVHGARPIRRPERNFSQSIHDLAAGREIGARKSIQGRVGQVSLCRHVARAIAQNPSRMAISHRRISRAQSERRDSARAGQGRHASRCDRAKP